jgi:hypothetical protein
MARSSPTYLQSLKLIGYLDGTQVAPEKTVAASTTVGAEQVSNPAYEHWYDQDQQLLSGLLSLMTEEVLRDGARSSREIWDSLQKKFASSTKACTVTPHISNPHDYVNHMLKRP